MKIIITIIIVVAIAGIALFLKQKSQAKNEQKFSDEEYGRHYEVEKEATERILGQLYELVGHAIIPFQIGGTVDMYYFPNAIPCTGFATMELIEPDGSGPKPNRIGTYELVTFTKQKMPPKESMSDANLPFNKIERRMCGIMTTLGNYSRDSVLNPGDTCEVPAGKDEPTICVILDEYKKPGVDFEFSGKKHCLLLCIEVFRSEMEYSMKNGSAAVLTKLKEKGYYPYSDLDREPVY